MLLLFATFHSLGFCCSFSSLNHSTWVLGFYKECQIAVFPSLRVKLVGFLLCSFIPQSPVFLIGPHSSPFQPCSSPIPHGVCSRLVWLQSRSACAAAPAAGFLHWLVFATWAVLLWLFLTVNTSTIKHLLSGVLLNSVLRRGIYTCVHAQNPRKLYLFQYIITGQSLWVQWQILCLCDCTRKFLLWNENLHLIHFLTVFDLQYIKEICSKVSLL